MRIDGDMDTHPRPESHLIRSGSLVLEDGFAISPNDQYQEQIYESDIVGSLTPEGSSQDLDQLTPLSDITSPAWSTLSQARSKSSAKLDTQTINSNCSAILKPTRPSIPARHVSNTYQPNRNPAPKGPHQLSDPGTRLRSFSGARESRSRRDPNAQYRAQEKAYIQQLRQDPGQDYYSDGSYTPSLDASIESESEVKSQASDTQFDGDVYDHDAQLFINNEDERPSLEEVQNPENRERLEWYSMLASVLRGDVVTQEKKRLIGRAEQKGEKAFSNELWLGIRAKVCGRGIPAQRRMVEEARAKAIADIESVITFQIKGVIEVGKPAVEQVLDVVNTIERLESHYPTRQALGEAIERAASSAFIESSEAVFAWHNTTVMINTELGVLQSWVGNAELDFFQTRASDGSTLKDDATFLERLNKDDTLKALYGEDLKKGKKTWGMLHPINLVIQKAKMTLIDNSQKFARRHLPPYIEELLTLINFPSRLMNEIIKIRLTYVVKDPLTMDPLMQAQMNSQFRVLLTTAVRIKQDYNSIAQQEPGWELPPCIDENFDQAVLSALQYYFKMVGSKLINSRNTFKEAEILEQESEFSTTIGRHFEGGDVLVAEQFSLLTAKALQRLTNHFEKELMRTPEKSPADMHRRYKQMLDSVRVRQRKLFRFSRLLSQRFENASEYNISLQARRLHEFYASLVESDHFLIQIEGAQPEGVYLMASAGLWDKSREIRSILGTSYRPEDYMENDDHQCQYVLILKPDDPLMWDGKRMTMAMTFPKTDLKLGRLRLVADGSFQRLQSAKAVFSNATIDLDVLTELRANLSRVNEELGKIKRTAYKLSHTIMESVEIIQKQTRGLQNQELIQTCFAFATEFGKRSLTYMDVNRRLMNNMKLTRLALDWVSFICDDCVASDRKTFRWAVVALEFLMVMTQGPNILGISDEEFLRLRTKVSGCMSLLISHFDIMGAKSTLAALAEKQRAEALAKEMKKMDLSQMKNDIDAAHVVQAQWLTRLSLIESDREQISEGNRAKGRVMESSNDVDRSLSHLSASATNVTMRWQLGQFLGAGSFGSVYAAFNIDIGTLMAVKEIRLQDPSMIPAVASQIRDEQAVLEVLDHPNVVQYYGLEVHRDKVYIFMEYCSGGSLANLLEHGRIEDETVLQVYALQMLEGLAYLHQASITHRDIKPENILLDQNGVIKFVDFGAAKVIARQNKTVQAQASMMGGGGGGGGAKAGGKQKSMNGTPMYMSPEVIKGTNEGRLGSVDIWSLGCVVLEMATGRRPWASLDNEWAIMYNIAQGNAPQLPSRDQLSSEGIEFVRRCLDRDARKRASAAELLQCDWISTIKSQVVPMADMSPIDRISTNSSSTTGSGRSSRQSLG